MEQRSTARQYSPTSCGRSAASAKPQIGQFPHLLFLDPRALSPKAPAACSFLGHSATTEWGQRSCNSRPYRLARRSTRDNGTLASRPHRCDHQHRNL